MTEYTELYQERYRPQYHITARQWGEPKLNPRKGQDGWLNDLNGMIYYKGEYHAFAQRWAECWLHWISTDLIHWTELPPAFYQDPVTKDGVQSGSIVIDKNNTSGLGTSKEIAVMVAFWHLWDNKSLCISYSNDRGRTWVKYAKNPILEFPERDPKVFWHELTKKWVMVLFGNNQYHFFTSPNLLNWKNENHPISNCHECPDFFEIPVEGGGSLTKWVLIRANGKYTIGSFDGTEFKEETPLLGYFEGPDYYATQTFDNTQESDGRRIQLAWMDWWEGDFPGMPFNQQMTFPCELRLKQTDEGLLLRRNPIREIETLHRAEHRLTAQILKSGDCLTLPDYGDTLHIKMQIEMDGNATLHIKGENVRIARDRLGIREKEVHLPKISDHTGRKVSTNLKTLEFLIDRTSVEVFANEGIATLSANFLPLGDSITLQCLNGTLNLHSVVIHELHSIWKTGGKPMML